MGKHYALALALGVGLLAPSASADPIAATPAQKAKAGELVKNAIAKSQAGDHEGAVELYEQAYMIIPQPLLLSNIGSEYKQQGKRVEAVKYFCKYLAEDPNGTNAAYASAQVKGMQFELGNETDEKDVCKVKPKAKETPPAPPPIPPPPPPGGGEQTTGTVGIDKGSTEPQKSHTLEYAGIGVGVAGLAAFGAGIYYGLQAQKISDSITHHDPTMMWPPDIKAQEAEGQSDQNKQILFMIAGGAVAGVGTFMFVIGHQRASSAEHVSVVPVATSHSMGLAIGGGF
jgi:tetratricopeptide (TPR) repeat protein